MKTRLTTIFVLLALFSINAQALQTHQLEDSIKSIMSKKGIPGLFISVVSKDSILWKKGLGYADVDTKSQVNEKHLFRIGSASKTFTAIAIMKLVKEGKLHLEDNLKDIAPEVPFKNKWEETHPVRLKHILEHKAGFDDMHFSAFAQQRTSEMTALDEVLVYKTSLTTRWKPGLVHSYSNPCYAILGYIIEKASGMRYQDYIQSHVLLPLRMKKTHYISESKRNSSYEFATGYTKSKDSIIHAKDVQLIGEAAGALLSNADDMTRFLHYFLNEDMQDSIPLIGKNYVQEMQRVHSKFELQNNINRGYSFALDRNEFGKNRYLFLGHSGYINGFSSNFIYNKELDLGIAISNNMGSSNRKILDLLVDTFINQKSKEFIKAYPKVELTKFKDWEGEYRTLNSRNSIFDFINYPFSTANVEVKNDSLIFTKFLGDEEVFTSTDSNGFKGEDELHERFYLTENEGVKSLYYYGTILVPANGVLFFMLRVALIISLLAGMLITLLFIIRLIIVPFKRSFKIPLLRTFIMALPHWLIFASIFIFLANSSLENLPNLGKIHISSISIFILSTLYPLASILAAYLLYKYWEGIHTKYMRHFYSLVVLGGLFMAGYCISHGWFLLSLWNY